MPRCRYCTALYKPARSMQPGRVCNAIECQARHAEDVIADRRKKTAKAERIAAAEDRKTVKLKLDKLKTARDWTKEAQIAFNAFIRERDKDKPCICCGVALLADAVGGGFDCGHYRSVGSAPHLRFDERNAHGQRKQCNRYGAGRAVDYRIGLVRRLGTSVVEALEADQTPRKYSIEDLKAIKAHYQKLTKELRNDQR